MFDTTGSKEVDAFIRGVVFKTDYKNQIHLILGNDIAPLGYGYLIIINGIGTLAVAYKKKNKKTESVLKELLKFSLDNLDMNILDYKAFSSYGSFSFNKEKVDSSGRLYIGEAGGFQDYLFGFGIQYAIESAVLAAESYKTKKSFNGLWKNKLKSYMRVSYRNRKFFERLNDDNLHSICKIISKSSNPVDLLRRRCQPGFLDKILNFF